MAYVLSPAANPMAIAEYEYAVAAQIRFAMFTSCIGVVALTPNRQQVGGIHLALFDPQSNMFGAQDVQTVVNRLNLMGVDMATVQVRGCVDVWRSSNAAVFRLLVAALGNPPTVDDDEGRFAITIVNGAINVAPY